MTKPLHFVEYRELVCIWMAPAVEEKLKMGEEMCFDQFVVAQDTDRHQKNRGITLIH